MRLRKLALLAGFLLACRGERPAPPRNDLESLVDSLKPSVEAAAGLRFKGEIKVSTRTRDQLRAFLLQKVDEQLPPERLKGTEYTYRLLGLLPDTLDLESFLVALLTEQVAGFYDPKTRTLYGIEGFDRTQLAAVMAHEMVHALQDQYLPLDSIMTPGDDDDASAAAQAILEGQATWAGIRALLPAGMTIPPELWTQSRDMIAAAQSQNPRFASAPLALREQLLFPYLSGAEFMMWWSSSAHKDTVPYGPLMPRSTEQILQPERYERGDEPVAVRFAGRDSALMENTLGDLGLRILFAEEAHGNEIAPARTLGWGGDRYRVYDTPSGPALVWYIAWDDVASADRFEQGTGAALAAQSRPKYRTDLTRVEVSGTPATRVVIAPLDWSRWTSLPMVEQAIPAP